MYSYTLITSRIHYLFRSRLSIFFSMDSNARNEIERLKKQLNLGRYI